MTYSKSPEISRLATLYLHFSNYAQEPLDERDRTLLTRMLLQWTGVGAQKQVETAIDVSYWALRHFPEQSLEDDARAIGERSSYADRLRLLSDLGRFAQATGCFTPAYVAKLRRLRMTWYSLSGPLPEGMDARQRPNHASAQAQA